MNTQEAFINLAEAIREHGEPECRETDPEAFFPDKGNLMYETRWAIKICERCPVRVQCLQFALANREPFGVWGGLTTPQRDRLLGKRRA